MKHVVYISLIYSILVWHVVPLKEHVLVMAVYVLAPNVVVVVVE